MSRLPATLLAVFAFVSFVPPLAGAQEVFDGDPIDPSTSRPYPLMPGLPLLLPGDDGEFGTGDDVVDTATSGDVDLVARVGSIASGPIPPPAGALGGPTLASGVAGGGSTGQGAETPFTILVSDGSGDPPYGTALASTELDARPVTVYAFADLDGDGLIGPTGSDGSFDDALERQEALAYAGRQVGQLSSGRVVGSIGVHLAAPASMGGLRMVLVAGAYTGSDPDALFGDGTPLFTLWPFFPPLDPDRVIGGGNVPPPDPDLPSEIEFRIERNYLPPPSDPVLGNPFAVPTDGSEPTTDQFVSWSGPVRAARFFQEVEPTAFRAGSRVWLRPAPAAAGGGRTLVLPVARLSLPSDGSVSQRALRLLPVDVLGNVADPDANVAVRLDARGPVRIVSPDQDSNPAVEIVDLEDAAGFIVVLDDDGVAGSARIDVTSGARILDSVDVYIEGGGDADGDAAPDEGNASTVEGDFACRADDPAATQCDDNCALTRNPVQDDSDADGMGDCCDGTCVVDTRASDCSQCLFVAPPPPPGTQSALAKVRVKVRFGSDTDKLEVRARLLADAGTEIAPPAETVSLEIVQSAGTAYTGALDALLVQVGAQPKYRYDDSSGAIDGVRRAVMTATKRGPVKTSWIASGRDLAPLSAGTAQIVIRVGDDTFAATVVCSDAAYRTNCSD